MSIPIVNNTGTNYTLYYNALNYFKTIMSNHPSIEVVTTGDLFDLGEREYPAYPIGNIQILETDFGTNVTNYEIYNVCSNTFTTTSGNQRGLAEMLNEGYLDLISGYTNCVFNSAELVCEVTISGVTYSQPFYTATTLNDVPQDSLWQSTIEDILDTIPNISSYAIDLLNNTLTVISTCSGDDDPLADEDFTLGLEITYDIVCGV